MAHIAPPIARPDWLIPAMAVQPEHGDVGEMVSNKGKAKHSQSSVFNLYASQLTLCGYLRPDTESNLHHQILITEAYFYKRTPIVTFITLQDIWINIITSFADL